MEQQNGGVIAPQFLCARLAARSAHRSFAVLTVLTL